MQVEEAKSLVRSEVTSTSAPDMKLFQLIVEQGPDAVIFANHQGKTQVWNNAATEFFGYLPNEALGQSLDIIIPDNLRTAHWGGFAAAIASGHTKHGKSTLRTRAIHKGGGKLYISLAFSIVKGRDGKVIGAMATARVLEGKSVQDESRTGVIATT